MSSNKLKIIACISMLIDHIGYLLLPNIYVLRLIGRIAMPIFAFFIAEGCRHTKNKLKYFLQVFLLGVFCQIIYTVNDIINGAVIDSIFLNILFTFSFSIVICYIYLEFEKAYKQNNKRKSIYLCILLLVAILCIYAFFRFFDNVFGIEISTDYGMRGILLPLFAILFTDKNKRIISFSIGLIGFMILMNKSVATIIFSSLAIPFLYLYDGTYGTKKLKYMFYIFYPTHLAVLYLINLII